MQSSNHTTQKRDSIPWRRAFHDLAKKYTEAGLLLRGGRHKAGLTQKELAEKLVLCVQSFCDNFTDLERQGIALDLTGCTQPASISAPPPDAQSRQICPQNFVHRALGILPHHISEMEHGKRSISKKMARKLGTIFQVDYRVFL